MSISPNDLMAVSNVMVGSAQIETLSQEIRLRQAASRAYYAAFHVIHEALANRSGNHHYSINHGALIEWLDDAQSGQLNSVGTLLRQAKKLREKSDYKVRKTVAASEVEEKLERLRLQILDRAREIAQAVQRERGIPNDGAGFPRSTRS